MENSEISKEEKERLLNERIRKIREQNEKYQQRQKEIETDKQLAETNSASAHLGEVKPYVMKPRTPRPFKPTMPEPSTYMDDIDQAKDGPSNVHQRLGQTDGPPPDPSYRFLADPDRDSSPLKEKKEDENSTDFPLNQKEHCDDREMGQGRGRSRGRGYRGRGNAHESSSYPEGFGDSRRGRGSRGRWGGRGRSGDRGRGRTSFRQRGSGNQGRFWNEMEAKKENQEAQWKAERHAIDEARLTRAKSNQGQWRREWDMDKVDQDLESSEPSYDFRPPPRKDDDIKLGDFIPCYQMQNLGIDDK